jgi:hypothetical protein
LLLFVFGCLSGNYLSSLGNQWIFLTSMFDAYWKRLERRFGGYYLIPMGLLWLNARCLQRDRFIGKTWTELGMGQ